LAQLSRSKWRGDPSEIKIILLTHERHHMTQIETSE
jgi:hypothetical protein